MDEKQILHELITMRDKLDRLIKKMQSGDTSVSAEDVTQAETLLSEQSSRTIFEESPPASEASSVSFLDVLDLSDDMQTVYVTVLKNDGLSIDEICRLPELQSVDGVSIIVKTLARQGQLKKYMEKNKVRYSSVTGKKGKKRISDDIWNVLE